MMGRIIDLEGFLLKYPIQVGNREVYYLKVADEYASWTEGIWELAIDEKGQGIVKKIDSSSPTVSEEELIVSTIQTTTQLFMGDRTASELNFYGKIGGKEKWIQLLDRRLAKGKPILVDYF